MNLEKQPKTSNFLISLLVMLAFSCCINSTRAQVVNMESRRMHTDSLRRAGDINLAFLYNSTNGKSISTIRSSLALQLKSKNYKHLWLCVANYDLAKAEGESYVNAFFMHLRYNYTIDPWLKWEVFTQGQINEPLGIGFRQITGTGPRFKIKAGDNSNFYLGMAYMYEYERSSTKPQVIHRDSRFSSYASFSISIPAVNGDIVSTLYYQPLFRDIADYRFTNETRIDFRITKKFRVYTRFNYYFDAQPPPNIRRKALGLEQGIALGL